MGFGLAGHYSSYDPLASLCGCICAVIAMRNPQLTTPANRTTLPALPTPDTTMQLKTLLVATTCAIAALTATATHAQTYPNKPIRMIVPFPPGGGVDFMSRILGQKLNERLGQQVVIDNRAGANGITGLQVMMASPADGYTIASASAGPLSVNPSVYKNLPYDPLRDFTNIARVCDFPLLLLVHPSLPVKNVRELIALSKSKAGQMSYGSSGAGNSDHLAAELLKMMAKLDVVHIPYKGAGPMSIALLAGEVPLAFSSIPPVLQQVRAGKLRALAVGSGKRIPMLPEVPTVAESGLPGYEAYSWGGIVGPANMPKEIVQRLNREIVEILKQKDVIDRLLGGGTVPTPSTPEEFHGLIRDEIKKWGEVVRAAKITAD
jgi:tripartite-type tricarboxylate transporter receptor subunit TctC